MPTFTGATFANFYKRILQINESSHTGATTNLTDIQTGDGVNTCVSICTNSTTVQPQASDGATAFEVRSKSGTRILTANTTDLVIKAGESQVNTLTLIKEMGLYDFSPTAGYHYPLIANTMFIPTGATAFAGDNDWGNGADPATTLDVSGLTAQENAVAVYWYLENNITLDSIRWMATADGSSVLYLHLFAYTLDTSTNHGNLSGGTVHANSLVNLATAATVKTGTFTLDEADIDAGKVVVGFVENSTGTADVTVSFNIKYHIR